jgi:RNA recognition motif-containing protein
MNAFGTRYAWSQHKLFSNSNINSIGKSIPPYTADGNSSKDVSDDYNLFTDDIAVDNFHKVRVKNLRHNTSWQDLKDHMRLVGEVRRVYILHDPRNRRIGQAIVDFYRSEDAVEAIDNLNGTPFQGGIIEVSPEPTNPVTSDTFSSDHQRRVVGCKVFVMNFDRNCTVHDLKEHFSHIGKVLFVEIFQNKKRSPNCAGIVTYERSEDAYKAIQELHGLPLMNRKLVVREDREEQIDR